MMDAVGEDNEVLVNLYVDLHLDEQSSLSLESIPEYNTPNNDILTFITWTKCANGSVMASFACQFTKTRGTTMIDLIVAAKRHLDIRYGNFGISKELLDCIPIVTVSSDDEGINSTTVALDTKIINCPCTPVNSIYVTIVWFNETNPGVLPVAPGCSCCTIQ